MKTKSHKCVFSSAEVGELQKIPGQMRSVNTNMKLILVLLVAFISVLLLPVGFVVTQSAKFGAMDVRLGYVESTIKQEFKKLYWTEKAHKEARDAVNKLIARLDEIQYRKKHPPPDPSDKKFLSDKE